MTIPVGYGQITNLFEGLACPNGAACVIGVENIGGLTAQELADLATVSWYNTIRERQTTSVSYLGTIAKLGPDATGASAVSPSTQPGLVSGDSCSAQVSWLVHKVSDLGGRRGRGRMYIPGILESEVNASGVIGGAYADLMQTAVTDYANLLVAGGVEPVILHEPGISGAPAPTTITAMRVDGRVATQRRRLRG